MDRDKPSDSDRMYAAWAYLLPIAGPLYVILAKRQDRELWRHAIQGGVLYLLLAGFVELTKQFPGVIGVQFEYPAVFVAVAGMVLCGFLAYRGHAVRLPWIADFADRWHGLAAGLIDGGFAALKQQGNLAMHRRNLKAFTGAPPKDVLPKVEGTPRMGGFQMEFAGGLGKLVVRLLGERMKPCFSRSEIVFEKWPLRLGDTSRVRFHAWPRKNAAVQSIAARLFCVEILRYRDDKNSVSTHGARVHGIDVADAAASASADGSTRADWTLPVPREGPPSFTVDGGGISWTLQVEMRFASGPSFTQEFNVLVVPQMAAP
jgi:uncharacterized membrane protein